MNKQTNYYLDSINKKAAEFAYILANETVCSQRDAQILIGQIFRCGDLEDAKQEYSKYGISGLLEYINIQEARNG